MCESFGDFLSHPHHHQPSVTMADKDNILKIFVLKNVHDVANVCLQVGVRASEMYSFAEARQCGSVHLLPLFAEQWCEMLPTPTPEPCTGNEDERHFTINGTVLW